MKNSSLQQTGNGFTLIELVIVLVIMSFVLALAGPAVTRGLSGLTLKTAAKKVAAAMRYARSQAVNHAQPYSVIFDRERGRIVICGIPQPVPPEEQAEDGAQDEEAAGAAGAQTQKPDIKIVALPEGIALKEITVGGADITRAKDELAQLVFYADGTSQGAELVLADSRDRTYQVNVAFLTGVVTIEEKQS
jgi:general secretion pathway protein H